MSQKGKNQRLQPKSPQAVEREFVDAFLENAERLTESPVSSTLQSFHSAGLTETTAAFLTVSSFLAPAQALALAGSSFAATHSDLAETVDQPYHQAREEVETLENSITLYSHSDVAAAVTSGSQVYVSPALLPLLDTPAFDWIVGHELGHIESQDGLAAIGRSFVIGHLEADGLDGEVLSSLKTVHHTLNQASEFESDLEGFEYALEQGHSRESILQSVGLFLKALPPAHGDTHPNSSLRLKRLEDREVNRP